MRRIKIGITLTDSTLKRLDALCQDLGMTKSQVISMLINTNVIKKATKGKGEAVE